MYDASSILPLNAKAVNELLSGNRAQAALFLGDALKLIQVAEEQENHPSSSSSFCTFGNKEAQTISPAGVLPPRSTVLIPVPLSSKTSSSSPTSSTTTTATTSSDVTDPCSVYDRAFFVGPQDNGCGYYNYNCNSNYNHQSVTIPLLLTEEEWTRISTAVLFNLALCFHLQGIDDVRVRDECFREANVYYLMAFGLLDPTSTHDADIRLTLAVLNNRGNLCSYFQDLMEGQECVNDLRFALEYLMNDGPPNVISPEDFGLYVKNIVYNERMSARAAPVA